MSKSTIIIQACLAIILLSLPANAGFGDEVTPPRGKSQVKRDPEASLKKKGVPNSKKRKTTEPKENTAEPKKSKPSADPLQKVWKRISYEPFTGNRKRFIISENVTWLSANLYGDELIEAKSLSNMILKSFIEKGFSIDFCANIFPYIEKDILTYSKRSTLFSYKCDASRIKTERDLPPLIKYSLSKSSLAIPAKIKKELRVELENQWLRIIQSDQGRQNITLVAQQFERLSSRWENARKLNIITHFAACSEDPHGLSGYGTFQTWLNHIKKSETQDMEFDEIIAMLELQNHNIY